MEYSDEVLEETPERVTRFLAGMAAVPAIRTALAQAHMTHADVQEGGALLLEVLRIPRSAEAEKDTPEAARQRAAVVELDDLDEPLFGQAKATLQRHFPEAAGYLFDDLRPSTGVQSVQGWATFLARVDHLEQGTEPLRAASREQDARAVTHLARRGLAPAERTRLAGLVQLALGPTPALSPVPEGPDPAERREKLVQLKLWYEEWSTIARSAIRKRSYLIRLGLAHRKTRSKEEQPVG